VKVAGFRRRRYRKMMGAVMVGIPKPNRSSNLLGFDHFITSFDKKFM